MEIITGAAGFVALFMILAVLFGPNSGSKRRRQIARKKRWNVYKTKKSVKDQINTEVIAELNDDAPYQQPTEAQIIEEALQKEFEGKVKIIEAIYNDNPYYGPPPDAVVLPDLSDDSDDEDWRACPYCGEWNKGRATRCLNCDGRLGRPLGVGR